MNHQLSKNMFDFYRLSEIKPQGWLLDQLKTQAAGLSGQLDQFWPDIQDSSWIGGSAEGWERVPYWLDGFIPLAFLLDDDNMKSRAKKYIDRIIAQQQDDGWICPENDAGRGAYDMWALFLILKVLVVWHDATDDGRIESVVQKALFCLDRHIDHYTLFGWAQTRWFEALIAIYWLYERTSEQWLLDLAVKLRAQGFDWVAFFEDWPMDQPLEKGRWCQMNHVVNQGMMLKSGPLYGRLSGQERDYAAAANMLELLDRYHGMVTGMFTGDECLAGQSPVHGTELCAVVEMMYSLEWLLALTGEPAWADRLELISFNALPATFSQDMNWHQYVQQVNQIQCSRQDSPVYMTNGPEANLFGVEPNFGCCTANMHQGWPKLALSIFMHESDDICIMMLLPSVLETKIDGVAVRVEVETSYPFRETARIIVKAQSLVCFTLILRIPAWAKEATILVDGVPEEACAGSYINIIKRWHDNVIEIELPMSATIQSRPNGLSAVVRGPLVYSLPVDEVWKREQKEDSEDRPWINNWEVFPASDWRFGLVLDGSSPSESIEFSDQEFGQYPFSPEGAPVTASVMGRSVPWQIENGAAAAVPSGGAYGPLQKLKLIPYGCTNLRLTEMPIVEAPE